MAYQLGRILHEHFGMECRIVTIGDESSSSSVFRYEKVFESIPLAQLAESIGPQDILIANPSFSNHLFGFRLNCVKLMYVQGYSTYSCIDGGFQHYVCVSSFVRDFVRFVYGIEAPVIPAYINGEPVPDPRLMPSCGLRNLRQNSSRPSRRACRSVIQISRINWLRYRRGCRGDDSSNSWASVAISLPCRLWRASACRHSRQCLEARRSLDSTETVASNI